MHAAASEFMILKAVGQGPKLCLEAVDQVARGAERRKQLLVVLAQIVDLVLELAQGCGIHGRISLAPVRRYRRLAAEVAPATAADFRHGAHQTPGNLISIQISATVITRIATLNARAK